MTPLSSRPPRACRPVGPTRAESVETYEPARPGRHSRVIAYTANDEPTTRSLIAMGVTAIEADAPKLLLRLKRELGIP